MTAKDGGAAFPFSPPVDDTGRSAVGYPSPELGMSLRDWFAGQALVGIGMWGPGAGSGRADQKVRAEWAYAQADAMLAALTGGAA